jgi:hypothetical protein
VDASWVGHKPSIEKFFEFGVNCYPFKGWIFPFPLRLVSGWHNKGLLGKLQKFEPTSKSAYNFDNLLNGGIHDLSKEFGKVCRTDCFDRPGD